MVLLDLLFAIVFLKKNFVFHIKFQKASNVMNNYFILFVYFLHLIIINCEEKTDLDIVVRIEDYT